MIFSIAPPIVSMPSDSGVTSSSSMSRLPVTRMSACTAAPSATTSSGFSSVCGRRAEQLLDGPPDQRDPRRAADHHHLVDLPRLERRVGKRRAAGHERPLDDGRDQPLELRAVDPPAIHGRRARAPPGRLRSSDSLLRREVRRFAWITAEADRLRPLGRDARRPCPPSPARPAGGRCRRRPGACRRWWPAPGRRRPRRGGSRCRRCRRRGRTPRSCPSCRLSRP